MRAGFVLLFLFLMSSFVLPSLLSPSSYGDTRGGAVSVGTQMKNVLFRPLTYTKLLLLNIWKSLPSYLMGDGIFLSMGHLGLAGFGSVTLLYTCGVMLTEDQSMRSKTFSKWAEAGASGDRGIHCCSDLDCVLPDIYRSGKHLDPGRSGKIFPSGAASVVPGLRLQMGKASGYRADEESAGDEYFGIPDLCHDLESADHRKKLVKAFDMVKNQNRNKTICGKAEQENGTR